MVKTLMDLLKWIYFFVWLYILVERDLDRLDSRGHLKMADTAGG